MKTHSENDVRIERITIAVSVSHNARRDFAHSVWFTTMETPTSWSDFFRWVARDMKRSSGDESAGFFRSRCASFRHAGRGFRFAFFSEPHLRVHLAVTLAVISGGLYFDLSSTEWSSVLLAIGLVLASELLNTAILLNSSCSFYIKSRPFNKERATFINVAVALIFFEL